MPLIDGTPTAISKFLREEEARHRCPKCGSELPDGGELRGRGLWFVRCNGCGVFAELPIEKVKK